jgi:O-antigen/teichoic acid export membrane protein
MESLDFMNLPYKKILPEDKKFIRKTTIPLSTIALSGIFFGYVDIFVLGRAVSSEFIGFYQAAFSIVGAIVAMSTFSAALLPIFSRMKGERFKKALSKSIKNNALLAMLIAIIVFVFAPFLVNLAFGELYDSATMLVRIFSILIIILPLNSLYSSSLVSQGKSNILAKLLISTTAVNLILNFSVAIALRSFGNLAIVVAICLTTVFSKTLFLLALFMASKK